MEFNEPVAVSLELDRSELEDEPEDEITAYALVSFTDDGEPELLENLVTEATLGEETVVARGELTHFSWLTKTKSSLTVRMDLLGVLQPVGGTFIADAEAQNSDQSGQVTLSATIGRYFTIGSVVSIQSGETFTGPAVLGNGNITRGVAVFKCDMPGVALYGVRVLALSVVEGQRGGTQLEVVVDRDVECFAPGPHGHAGPYVHARRYAHRGARCPGVRAVRISLARLCARTRSERGAKLGFRRTHWPILSRL